MIAGKWVVSHDGMLFRNGQRVKAYEAEAYERAMVDRLNRMANEVRFLEDENKSLHQAVWGMKDELEKERRQMINLSRQVELWWATANEEQQAKMQEKLDED